MSKLMIDDAFATGESRGPTIDAGRVACRFRRGVVFLFLFSSNARWLRRAAQGESFRRRTDAKSIPAPEGFAFGLAAQDEEAAGPGVRIALRMDEMASRPAIRGLTGANLDNDDAAGSRSNRTGMHAGGTYG
jgi:hypothetical protein